MFVGGCGYLRSAVCSGQARLYSHDGDLERNTGLPIKESAETQKGQDEPHDDLRRFPASTSRTFRDGEDKENQTDYRCRQSCSRTRRAEPQYLLVIKKIPTKSRLRSRLNTEVDVLGEAGTRKRIATAIASATHATSLSTMGHQHDISAKTEHQTRNTSAKMLSPQGHRR